MTRYVVTAECVLMLSAVNARGPMTQTFYRDAPVPDDVPAAQLEHLLANGLVAAVAEPEPAA